MNSVTQLLIGRAGFAEQPESITLTMVGVAVIISICSYPIIQLTLEVIFALRPLTIRLFFAYVTLCAIVFALAILFWQLKNEQLADMKYGEYSTEEGW